MEPRLQPHIQLNAGRKSSPPSSSVVPEEEGTVGEGDDGDDDENDLLPSQQEDDDSYTETKLTAEDFSRIMETHKQSNVAVPPKDLPTITPETD